MLDKKLYCVKINDETQFMNTTGAYNENSDENKKPVDNEELYNNELEKGYELEEKKYSRILSISYALVAITSESPYFVIVSLADFFKSAFNVNNIMINEFTIIESTMLIIVCFLLHLIGSYRLKWNSHAPLLFVIILGILSLVVLFKCDYIGHKIVIFSAFPLGFVLCISKMTTMKICALFRKPYCSSYICGLSLSGFLVFTLYVFGAYVIFPKDKNFFRNMFLLFTGTISLLSIICYSMLNKIYKMPFVKSLEDKYGDKGIYINKNIIIRSFYSIPVAWGYILLAFLSNYTFYQIYPSVFPVNVNISAESKGLISGTILFADSLVRLIVHNLSSYFIKLPFSSLVYFAIIKVLIIPIFPLIVIYKNFAFLNMVFLLFLASIFGFLNGLLCETIFLQLPELCKNKKGDYIQLVPNIVSLFLLLGTTTGCITSKIYMKLLPAI